MSTVETTIDNTTAVESITPVENTAPAVETPKIAPEWADRLDEPTVTELMGVSNLRQNCLESKVNDKPWKPRNPNVNRAHLQYAAANSLHQGLLTWGEAARQYPCLKPNARTAILAAGMADVSLNDRTSITRILNWIANGGKHVEVPKKAKTAETVETAPEVSGEGDGV
jgi:hypothetical protein